MKTRYYILIVLIVVFGGLWLISHRSSTATPTQLNTIDNLSATRTAMLSASRVASAPSNSTTGNAGSTLGTYQQGEIGKDQAVQATIQEENQKSLDLYGKVLDQSGNPIVGAQVRGAIGVNISMVASGGEMRYTQTDAQGCFNFVGIHGAGIGIWPQKDGYYYNLKIPWQRPRDYFPDPNNPLIFTMWKIRGGEPLIHASINADLATDGSTVTFDSMTGAQSDNGDLKISFLRSPEKLKPGLVHPFNWKFKIEFVNGGLIAESDPYPYWPPDNGFQSSFEFNASADNLPWQNQLVQSFYIKTASGKYGVMSLTVFSASTPPEAQVNVTLNPSGSQNLEPDFSQQ